VKDDRYCEVMWYVVWCCNGVVCNGMLYDIHYLYM
jgi:hypothetical protein